MSTVKPTAKQVEAIVEVLNDDHPSATAAAKAVWDAMHDEIIARGKYVVAAQLVGTRERPRIAADDPESVKVALSLFATAGDAQKAAESLVLQPATGDRYLCWVIPVIGMTAAEFTKKRREEITAAEAKRADKLKENLRAQIEKRRLRAQAMADAISNLCKDRSHSPRITPNGGARCPECESEDNMRGEQAA